ncbi:hypothetical protein VTK56DRAFT_8170 [Thermocarpiscus australiensis]
MAESTTVTISSTGRDAGEVDEAALPVVPTRPASAAAPPTSARPEPPQKKPVNQVYALPAPIRTFPLPTFYPNNPISLFHLAYAWLSQVFRPPPPEPSVVHVGVWDPETRSVHVRDPTSIRALWEQGFFGKGSLSRSEPNWLKMQLARRGSLEGKTVSEVRTESRREERRLAKWERAKAELEAIERQRLAEAASSAAVKGVAVPNGVLNGHIDHPTEPAPALHSSSPSLIADSVAEAESCAETAQDTSPAPISLGNAEKIKPPVGPAELLALPNSLAELNAFPFDCSVQWKPPVTPAQLLSLPNSLADLMSKSVNGSPRPATGKAVVLDQEALKPLSVTPRTNGHIPAKTASLPAPDPESQVSPSLKRGKSVRFSPKVESTTFQHSDPPSPNHRSASAAPKNGTPPTPPNGETVLQPNGSSALPPSESLTETTPIRRPDPLRSPTEIENKEHFQLSPEEAFFLAFALGALSVVDPVTASPIPTEHLLDLFRSYSYFPPRAVGSPSAGLGPDDPFLVHYAVYHHFRSLGWVPRHGIKFGVDWLLYQRGPVFDHSEFGVVVMPAFSDPLWEGHERSVPKRPWSWLMGVNRVLSHALKSLVLVYVDIPSPAVFDESMRRGGVAAVLKKYTIREVMVRRFSVNRNR